MFKATGTRYQNQFLFSRHIYKVSHRIGYVDVAMKLGLVSTLELSIDDYRLGMRRDEGIGRKYNVNARFQHLLSSQTHLHLRKLV